MVIDWDMHHGNGTAETFRHRPDVLVCDIHQTGCSRYRSLRRRRVGPGTRVYHHLPVPAWSDEEVWLSLLEHIIVPIGLGSRPQLSSSRPALTPTRPTPRASAVCSSSFGRMACHVRELGEALDAPVGGVLEGGYDPPALADSTVATIAALLGHEAADSAAPDPLITRASRRTSASLDARPP